MTEGKAADRLVEQETKPEEELGKATSMLPEDVLMKSLDKIEAIAKTETPDARKRALLEKSLAGPLSTDETTELTDLLRGVSGPSLGKALAANLDGNKDGAMQKAMEVDVTGALEEMVAGIRKSLGEVGEELQKSSRHQGEVNLVLAKGLLDTGRLVLRAAQLIKAVDAKFDGFLAQPSGLPKGKVGGVSPLGKAFGGAAPAEDQISKGQILDLMEEMLEVDMKKSGQGRSPGGEDLVKAIASVEQGAGVSQALMKDLAAFRRQKANGAAG